MVNNSEIQNINKKQTTLTLQIRTSGRVEISLVRLPYCLYLKDALSSESFGPGEEEMNHICLIVSFLDKQEWRSPGWDTRNFEPWAGRGTQGRAWAGLQQWSLMRIIINDIIIVNERAKAAAMQVVERWLEYIPQLRISCCYVIGLSSLQIIVWGGWGLTECGTKLS